VFALERLGLVKVSDNTSRVEVTADGAALLMQGFVELKDIAS
jgi:hypothetical protein